MFSNEKVCCCVVPYCDSKCVLTYKNLLPNKSANPNESYTVLHVEHSLVVTCRISVVFSVTYWAVAFALFNQYGLYRVETIINNNIYFFNVNVKTHQKSLVLSPKSLQQSQQGSFFVVSGVLNLTKNNK